MSLAIYSHRVTLSTVVLVDGVLFVAADGLFYPLAVVESDVARYLEVQ